jgi:tRNA(fMet)-specific endonuclease VapC
MKFLMDANTRIGWLRGNQPSIVARIARESQADIVICSVVLGELIFGAERSGPIHRAANLLRVEQLRQQFRSLPFDDVAAEEYGRLRAFLANQGTPIGPNDTMIAAIALAHSLRLATHNTTEFSRVPGLLIEDWQIP